MRYIDDTYREVQRKCKFSASKVAVKITDLYDERDGKHALYNGPVPAILDSSNFKNYG